MENNSQKEVSEAMMWADQYGGGLPGKLAAEVRRLRSELVKYKMVYEMDEAFHVLYEKTKITEDSWVKEWHKLKDEIAALKAESAAKSKAIEQKDVALKQIKDQNCTYEEISPTARKVLYFKWQDFLPKPGEK